MKAQKILILALFCVFWSTHPIIRKISLQNNYEKPVAVRMGENSVNLEKKVGPIPTKTMHILVNDFQANGFRFMEIKVDGSMSYHKSIQEELNKIIRASESTMSSQEAIITVSADPKNTFKYTTEIKKIIK